MIGKGDHQAIREVNRSISLDLVRRGGQVSRTELARGSKLTKPMVSTIIIDGNYRIVDGPHLSRRTSAHT